MDALFDGDGEVYAWLNEDGKIYGLDGQNLAFIEGDSIYDWDGNHVGWWTDGHIRDSYGAVALFTSEASNLGVLKPMRALRPLAPLRELSPMKPMKSMKPMRPLKQMAWAENLPF
jgi:hypothetical protein